MRKIVLIIAAVLVTSCGALEGIQVESAVYSRPNCITSTYQYGVYGYGFYDCFGRFTGAGFYGPAPFVGPRVIVRRARPKPKPRVRVQSPTRRGATLRTTRTRGRRQ